jgi:hypothetical protein
MHHNLVVRALAQGLQIPLVDLHAELLALPGWGLVGDGIHLDVFSTRTPRQRAARPCNFTSPALEFGVNIRNLTALESLDRLRRFVFSDEEAPDGPSKPIVGSGSSSDPVHIDRLPFVDMGSTDVVERRRDASAGRTSLRNERGGEVYYRVVLDSPARLTALVIPRRDVEVDLQLLKSGPTGNAFGTRSNSLQRSKLPAGEYYLAVDASEADPGIEEYLLIATVE